MLITLLGKHIIKGDNNKSKNSCLLHLLICSFIQDVSCSSHEAGAFQVDITRISTHSSQQGLIWKVVAMETSTSFILKIFVFEVFRTLFQVGKISELAALWYIVTTVCRKFAYHLLSSSIEIHSLLSAESYASPLRFSASLQSCIIVVSHVFVCVCVCLSGSFNWRTTEAESMKIIHVV